MSRKFKVHTLVVHKSGGPSWSVIENLPDDKVRCRRVSEKGDVFVEVFLEGELEEVGEPGFSAV